MFNRILAGLAAEGGRPDQLMIDATHLKADGTAANLLKKGLFSNVSAEPRASLTPAFTRSATTVAALRVMLLTEGQTSDYQDAGAAPISTGQVAQP